MKINKEIIQKLNPLFQAIAEGKDIQVESGDGWMDIDLDGEGINVSTLIACPESYRIKPEAKYRPFKNAEECWQEMLNHQPFGWIVDGDSYRTIAICDDVSIEVPSFVNDDFLMSFKEAMDSYTFADGTPFGIKDFNSIKVRLEHNYIDD